MANPSNQIALECGVATDSTGSRFVHLRIYYREGEIGDIVIPPSEAFRFSELLSKCASEAEGS